MFDFDLDKLNTIIANNEKSKSNFESDESRTKISYLKEGTHKLRFLIDPTNEISRLVCMHNVKFQEEGQEYETRIKTLCPDQLNQVNSKNPKWAEEVQAMNPKWKEEGRTKLPDCEICACSDRIGNWRVGLGAKYNHLMYAALYQTDKADDYWVPEKNAGNLYCVVANSKAKNSLMDLIKSMATDAPEYIMKSLNPTKQGWMMTVTVTRGTQGSVTMSLIPGSDKPALFDSSDEDSNIRKQFKPLTEVFLSSTFDIDSYNKAVELAKKVEAGYADKVASGEIEVDKAEESSESTDSSTSQTNETSTTSSTDQSKIADAPFDGGKVVETKSNEEVKTGLSSNQRKLTGMDRVITLPQIAIDENCWSQYDPAQPKCITCPINIECMTENVALKKAS